MAAVLWTDDLEDSFQAAGLRGRRSTARAAVAEGAPSDRAGAPSPNLRALLRSVLELVRALDVRGRRARGRNEAVPEPAVPGGEPTTVHPWRSLPARRSVPQRTAASGPGASPGTAHSP